MSTSTASRLMPWPRAVSARVASGQLVVRLLDGRELAVPVDEFDFLAAGTDAERQQLELVGGGAGIWWDLLDDGVSVPGLFGLPESPPRDPDAREYVVRYRRDEKGWIAEVEGMDLSTVGGTLAVAKRHARELLRMFLQVRDLAAAGIGVIDQVDSTEPVQAR